MNPDSGSAVAVVLYRALMQTTRQLNGRPLRLRLPLDLAPVQWLRPGMPQFVKHAEDRSAAAELFPWVRHEAARQPEIEPSELRAILREEFRRTDPPPSETEGPLDRGLYAMRTLSEQLSMANSSSFSLSTPLEGCAVRAEATSAFRGRDEPSGKWVFAYRIRIANQGSVPVQVIGREWEIRNKDGSLHAAVPWGSPGVVGQTPRLLPGESFEYMSGTTLATAGGSVRGSLQMKTLEEHGGGASAERADGADADAGGGAPVGGRAFDATIEPFACVVNEK